jgi:transcriptional regulator with XRE-family HTH domain
VLGLNIRRIRESKNMTQLELAEKVGLTNTSLSQMEKGKMTPSLATLERIAAVLGVPISDLFRNDPTGLQDALGVYLRARGPWTPDQEERLRQDIELVIRLQKARAKAEHEAEEHVREERRRDKGPQSP